MLNLFRRDILKALTGVSLASVSGKISSANDLIIRPQIEGVDPRYQMYATIGTTTYPPAPIIYNGATNRTYVFAPNNVDKAQMIVFSHGVLSDPTTYRDLIWHWVSHGFVVVAPEHDDGIIRNGPSMRKQGAGDVSEWPIPALLEDPKAWNSRLHACRAALDMGYEIKKATGVEIDMSRPVIAGHGYGAYIAALAIGATVIDHDKRRLSFRDTRFFSAICMSPQGPGVMGLDEQSWKDVKQPVLTMVSEKETDFTGQPWQTKAQSYKLSAPGYKHFALLKGGSSNTFGGQMQGTSTVEAKLYEVIKAFTTSFLLAYSNYDKTAFQDLTTDFFERMSLGAIDEYRR